MDNKDFKSFLNRQAKKAASRTEDQKQAFRDKVIRNEALRAGDTDTNEMVKDILGYGSLIEHQDA